MSIEKKMEKDVWKICFIVIKMLIFFYYDLFIYEVSFFVNYFDIDYIYIEMVLFVFGFLIVYYNLLFLVFMWVC